MKDQENERKIGNVIFYKRLSIQLQYSKSHYFKHLQL